MKNFGAFFLGFVTFLLVGAAAAAWVFFLAADTVKAPVLSGVPMPATGQAPATQKSEAESAAPANIPAAVVRRMGTLDTRAPKAGFALEGELLLPPPLRKLLEGKTDTALLLEANIGSGTGKNLLEGAPEITKLSFPLSFRLPLDPAAIAALPNVETFRLVVRAVICFNRDKKPCTATSIPRLTAKVDLLARTPGGLKEATGIKTPALVFNRYFSVPDSAACAKANSTISGSVQPSPKFFSSSPAGTYLVVGRPFLENRLPYPYGEGLEPARPLSRIEADRLEDFGIVSAEIILKNGPSHFSLRIPERHNRSHYRLAAVACKETEPRDDCLLRSFPIDRFFAPVVDKIGQSLAQAPSLFDVIGQGFELPTCGAGEKLYYVHSFQKDSPFARSGAETNANPPELIEGVLY